MGERGLDEAPATGDDIAAMARLVDEAMAAGALGVSTSRTFMHKVPDGRPVPGTYAAADELLAFAEVLREHGAGVFEGAMRLGERDNDDLRQHPRRGRADGRDQSAQRPTGQLRTDPEQPTARPVRAGHRLREGRERRRRQRSSADDGARRRHPVRSRDDGHRSTVRRRGRNCAAPSTAASCRWSATPTFRQTLISEADVHGTPLDLDELFVLPSE